MGEKEGGSLKSANGDKSLGRHQVQKSPTDKLLFDCIETFDD